MKKNSIYQPFRFGCRLKLEGASCSAWRPAKSSPLSQIRPYSGRMAVFSKSSLAFSSVEFKKNEKSHLWGDFKVAAGLVLCTAS